MRKSNSVFKTAFVSEAGAELANNDYFAYIEDDDFACYAWVELEKVLTKKFPVQRLADEIISLINNSLKLDKDNATILICRQKMRAR